MLLLVSVCCKAQTQGQQLVDSLLKQLPAAGQDSFRVKLLNNISNAYKTINPDKGIQYAMQALDLSQSLNLRRGIGASYNVLGLNYHYKSDYAKALYYFNKALAIFADNPTSGPYGTVISHMAVLYQEMGDLDKALEYNNKALELDIRIGDSVNIGGDFGNIGIIYLLKKDYGKALEYDMRSMEIFRALGDKDGIAHNLGNVGNVYKEMGDYAKALEYDTKALNLFRELGDNGGIALNLGNIGGVYISIVKQLDSTDVTKEGYIPLGSRSIFLSKAISNLQQSLDISRRIGQLDNIIEFGGGLYEAYSLAGDDKAALAALKEHMLFKDSVYSRDTKERIAHLETQREGMLKDKQIEIEKLQVAQKRNERIILFIAVVLLLVILIVIAGKFRRQVRDNKQLALEKKRHLDRIEKQRTVMGDIAYKHSHEVSAHVATILGLVSVFNIQDYADADNKVVLDGVAESAHKLDEVVKDMIARENTINSDSGLQ